MGKKAWGGFGPGYHPTCQSCLFLVHKQTNCCFADSQMELTFQIKAQWYGTLPWFIQASFLRQLQTAGNWSTYCKPKLTILSAFSITSRRYLLVCDLNTLRQFRKLFAVIHQSATVSPGKFDRAVRLPQSLHVSRKRAAPVLEVFCEKSPRCIGSFCVTYSLMGQLTMGNII